MSYLCMANLNLRDRCLKNASIGSIVVKKFAGTEWMTKSFKENWNVSAFKKEWSYAPTDWAYEAQLTDLHESNKSRKLVLDRLAEDPSSLALPISIGGALLSMLFSIGTCLLVFDRRPVRRAAPAVVVENKVQTPQSIPTVPTIVVAHSEQPQPPLYPALPIVTSIAPRVLGTMNSPLSSKLETGGLDF